MIKKMTFFTSILIPSTIFLAGFSTYAIAAVSSCTGNLCNATMCDSNPCKNGATCLDHNSSFSCVCKPDLTGRLCELHHNRCDSTPCQNGGTCTNGVDAFTCTCARGFTGETCGKRTGDCPDPPSIVNGTVRLRNSYGFYTCNRGYKTLIMIGSRIIRCVNGKWNGKPPTCQSGVRRSLCKRPDGIRQGYFEPQKDEFTVGSIVKYVCNGKYRLRGNAELMCTKDGKWSPTKLPRCTKSN
ncbi:fibropellin-3-like [Orbicella faveolata]|uniref:fibropellin-3-like n=1 Tax=Orbicella faveolata TaxID=48498 RepID=UPI0009E2F164|nr:fibropellin-3-like [Orbicella faveolata]XP_020601059.1 fibropellin-3-like [Orbicella faveolata]